VTRQGRNLLFQSEHHPLVTPDPGTPEQLAQALIHTKAYQRAEAAAKGLKVLDLGCNTGYGTRLIARSAREVWGIDVSERAVQAARESASAENVSYELSDGESLRFEDGAFDLVTSFQVIEHVLDVGPYLSEISRVPNGTLRLIPGRPPWNIFHVREYSADQLSGVLEHRFEEVRILGLFAEDDLYTTELRRIERARRIARNPALFALKRLVLPRLGNGVLHRIETAIEARAAMRHAGASRATRNREPDWTLDSLHYRDAPLDRALDLLATCRKAR
jgi:SAM-dependent methyltransferase